MSWICLNGNMQERTRFGLEIENRMFRYHDGFFESCRVEKGVPKLWNYHKVRINKGFEVLKMNMVDFYDLEHAILELYEKEEFNFLNICFWRNSEGLYEPVNTGFTSYLLIPRNKPESAGTDQKMEMIGISRKIRNQYSVFSFLKTNSLKYVLAGIEKQENEWDDIIILDNDENISECLYSNLFWKKGDRVFTPSLETGCVEGVYRSFFIDQCRQKGIEVIEGKWQISELVTADEIFKTNISGIQPLNKEGIKLT